MLRIVIRVVSLLLLAQLLGSASPVDDAYLGVAFAQEGQEATAPNEGAPAEGGLVIPPGQESILAKMLGQGEQLPDGCQLLSGHVEYRVVQARYQCPGGEVLLELAHPSQAEDSAARTDRFAIVMRSGSPPDGFVEALQSRIRSNEAGFEWLLVTSQPGGSEPPPSSGPLSTKFPWVRVAVAGALLLAIIGWVMRKRGG